MRQLLLVILGIFALWVISSVQAEDADTVLPPMAGLDDIVVEPYLGQNVQDAVRFGFSPVVAKVTQFYLKEGENLTKAFINFGGLTPATQGLCFRFASTGSKTVVFKGLNAMGQQMESKHEFVVVGLKSQSAYCEATTGARVFLNSKPAVTVWSSKSPTNPNNPNKPPPKPGTGKHFDSYRARFPESIMIDHIRINNANRRIFIELQRVAKQFGIGEGSLFNLARIEGQRIANEHGYGDTPCAEVQSAVLRNVFARTEGNSNFAGSPLVTDLNKILSDMGWIVWDPGMFYPTPGAIGMHTNGISPSHTYLIGGLPEKADENIPGIGSDYGEYANGRYILDNASGHGIDLEQLTGGAIAHQYNTGAFWLPLGVVPRYRKPLSN